MKKIILALLILLLSQSTFAGKLEKGFERLGMYDYFKAKEYFEDALKNDSAAAAYGLSKIFTTEKNPFYNLDSARRYVLISADFYSRLKARDIKEYATLGVNSTSISSLSDFICEQAYLVSLDADSVEAYDHYLNYYQSCSRYSATVQLRNGAAFRDAKFIHTSKAYKTFMEMYPAAKEISDAQAKFEERLYAESVWPKDIHSYETFILNQPESPYRKEAERMIYVLSVPDKQLQQYVQFVRKYKTSSFTEEAWREVYKLSFKDFSQETYRQFKNDFPDYPFMNELENDFELENYTFLPFKKSGKWGFINENGKEMIKPAYDDVSMFSEGLCVVINSGKAGYINKAGKIVIPLRYNDAESFHNRTAVVKTDSLYGLINRNGELIIPTAFDELADPVDGFSVGVKNGRAAYISKNGKPLTPFMFDVASDFKEGYAIVSTEEKYGMIDLSGRFKIEPVGDEMVWIDHSKVKLSKNDKWGVLNVQGDTLLLLMYDFIGDYSQGRALIAKSGKCGFIDESGKIVIPVTFQFSASLISKGIFQNGYVSLVLKGKPVVVDTNGVIINYPGVEAIGEYGAEMIPIMKMKKWGYADISGKIKIPTRYDAAFAFVNGIAKVKIKKQFGLIDRNGTLVIAPVYDDIEFKTDGFFVRSGGMTGLLQSNGQLLLACEYDSVELISPLIAKAMRGQKITYVNLSTGRIMYNGE